MDSKLCRARHRAQAALAVLLLGAMPALAAAQTDGRITIDTLAIRNDTRILAADSLLGRGTGSRGAQRAAAYIAERLRQLGLEPAGTTGDYLQPVPLEEVRISAGSRLIIRDATDSTIFTHGDDFHVATGGMGAFRSFEGEAIFAGTADNAAASVRNTDVSGKVLVLLGPLPEHADSVVGPWVERGVAGIVLLFPDSASLAAAAGRAREPYLYVAAQVNEMVWQSPIPTILAGLPVARALLRGARIPQGAFEGQPFEAVPLSSSIAAIIETSPPVRVSAANLIARIPGTDPSRRNQILLYTAHYDHLGIGQPDARGDSIYNGFSDNAAGVAMLLAVADAFRRSPQPVTIAFAFLTGEERGLLGSSYLAENPPWPLERILAVINLDGGAPPRPPVSWRIAGAEGAWLGELAREVGRTHGWSILLSPGRPNSDYWPFLRRGVAAGFIIPGNEWEGTTAAERDALRRLWDHYHQPADEWHEEFPFAGLGRYATLAYELGLAVIRHNR